MRPAWLLVLLALFGALCQAGSPVPLERVWSLGDFTSFGWNWDAESVEARAGYLLVSESLYDKGLYAPVWAEGDFTLSLRFRAVETRAWGGCGLFFGLTSPTGARCGHMSRVMAGNQVLAGSLLATQFADQGVTGCPDLGRGWHTFEARIKASQKTWSIALDGKVYLADLPLKYLAGYIGVDVCDGTFQLAELKLIPTSPAKPDKTPKHLAALAAEPSGAFYTPLPVHKGVGYFSPEGKLVGIIRLEGFSEERAWAGLAEGEGAVWAFLPLPEGKTRLFRLSEGRLVETREVAGNFWQATVLGPDRLALREPTGRIVVIQTSREGAEPLIEATLGGRDPRIAGLLDRLALASKDHLEIYSLTVEPESFDLPKLGQPEQVLARSEGLYIVASGKVRLFDWEGKPKASFEGKRLEGFSAASFAFGKRPLVGDAASGALIAIDSKLDEFTPRVETTSEGSWISWRTATPQRGKVLIEGENGFQKAFEEATTAAEHSLLLAGLAPAQRYKAYLEGGLEVVSGPRPPVKPVRFVSPAPEGQLAYIRYPVAVCFLPNVIDDRNPPKEGQPPFQPASEAEIARVKDELEQAFRFYWIHSHFAFCVEPTWLVDETVFKRSEVYEEGDTYPPRSEVMERLCATVGKTADDFPAVLFLGATTGWDEARGAWRWSGRGGGWTYGVPAAEKGHGLSWWEPTPPDHMVPNSWLFIHEFNHQVDGLFQAAGYDDYWFNHYAPSEGNTGDFGEWMDADRFVLRRWSRENWLLAPRGEVATMADADEDGLPDSDPKIWFDEARFGSSPTLKDTDGDGLSDGEEVALGLWIRHGIRDDYWAGGLRPNPADYDTDGDGLGDAEDPLPLYPVADILPLVEDPGAELARPVGPVLIELADPRVEARFHLAQSEGYLWISCSADRPFELHAQFDFGLDGWFAGRDNWDVWLESEGDGPPKTRLFDASSLTEWPRDDWESLKSLAWRYARGTIDGQPCVVVGIPETARYGLALKPGQQLNLRLGARVTQNIFGDVRELGPFEPNTFAKFTF